MIIEKGERTDKVYEVWDTETRERLYMVCASYEIDDTGQEYKTLIILKASPDSTYFGGWEFLCTTGKRYTDELGLHVAKMLDMKDMTPEDVMNFLNL
jgi:hypothetical protein